MIQLRTMMPPKSPQTVGFAVWGALLPTTGTLTGGAMAGKGASGIGGKTPATFPATVSVVSFTPFPTVEGAPTATSAASLATGISGASSSVPSVVCTKHTTKAKRQWRAVLSMFPDARLRVVRVQLGSNERDYA